MRLNVNNLTAHCRQPLRPVYLVAGDEPLQSGEALDGIRAAARRQGCTEREVLEHDRQFDWDQLAMHAASMSLFGDRRLIELRLGSSKIGADGSKAVLAYVERPPEDAILLIVSPKLERSQLTAKWVKAIEGAGALIQVWPVDGAHLPGWLDQRMRNRGLIPNVGVAGWLAERVEGNLLAAAQEIEKLLLLHGEGPVSLERMMSGVADSARYTVFDLADSALEGKSARCLRVLQLLRAEGTADALVLWALTREARLLAGLAAETRTGRPLEQVVGGRREIWEKKRSLYVGAVKRHRPAAWLRILAACGQADAMVKGACKGDPWLAMEDIVLAISRKGAVIDVLPGQRAHCGA